MKPDKKTVIIETALDCFVKNGFSTTKLSDIAKKAKLPAPLIHYYFEDLDDLQYHVILHAAEGLKNFGIENMRKASHNPRKALEEYLRTPFKWAEGNPQDFATWIYFYSIAVTNEKYKKLLTDLLMTGRERIRLMIYQVIEAGDLKLAKGITVDQLAFDIQTWIHGLLIRYGSENHGKKASVFSDQLIAYVYRNLCE